MINKRSPLHSACTIWHANRSMNFNHSVSKLGPQILPAGGIVLNVVHLRAKAAEYRAAAKMASDARTQDLYLSVAKYLDDWAAQIEAKEAIGAPHQLRQRVAPAPSSDLISFVDNKSSKPTVLRKTKISDRGGHDAAQPRVRARDLPHRCIINSRYSLLRR